MQNEIKVNDKFILHSSDGKNYKMVIYNVNYYRLPSMTYAVLVYDEKGNSVQNGLDDFFFIGENFFIKHEGKIERI